MAWPSRFYQVDDPIYRKEKPNMSLPLAADLKVGFMGVATDIDSARRTAEFADTHGFESVWTGDHMAFPMPILDPLLQLELIAAFNPRITVGSAVYLLPLRHPTPVAKQVATLDRLIGGRFIFGVGIGGEFPIEYDVCGVPVKERGARLSEAIPILKGLWSGQAFSSDGVFYPIPEVTMLPAPVQSGGPPIWCGGRSDAALSRIGRLADGWISYVVTPEKYREGLETIAGAAERGGRTFERFGTAHLLFAWIDDDYERALDAATEHLSMRYAMDFRSPARRYAALGSPADVAAKIAEFRSAGVRHIILDMTGPSEQRDAQLARFAAEVRPLL